jgi:hypothetical protein
MEHRYSTARHPCDIKVLIYRYENPIAFGRIKNYCSQGMLIETNVKDIHLTQQLKFEVISSSLGRRDIDAIYIDALVVHISKNGFGVEIDIPVPKHAEIFFSSINRVIEWTEKRESLGVVASH